MANQIFPCTHCGAKIECDEDRCGCLTKCPSCQADVLVPISHDIGLQILISFQVPERALMDFDRKADGDKTINWRLTTALAQSALAIQSDWKVNPTELFLDFQQRLQSCEALRPSNIKIDLAPAETDEPTSISISIGGKPSKSYRWTTPDELTHADVAFAFAELVAPAVAVYSLKEYEVTDTFLCLIAPAQTWQSVHDLIGGCFDQLFASHKSALKLRPVKAAPKKASRVDWRKLWGVYEPSTHDTPDKIALCLDRLRPLSANDLFSAKEVLRTTSVWFFLYYFKGTSFDSWRIDRRMLRLPTLLYTVAASMYVGALWENYAFEVYPNQKFPAGCLKFGNLIWAYFIYSALNAQDEAHSCARLLESEPIRAKERCALNRGIKSHYDLAIYLHNGSQGDELNELEPMLAMTSRQSWEDPAKITAALKAHCQTRGEQFVHDSIKWTWPATLYALARRANALDLLPKDNPFLNTPLDASMVDRSDPYLKFFADLESRYRSVGRSRGH
jgi:hypothetical protein